MNRELGYLVVAIGCQRAGGGAPGRPARLPPRSAPASLGGGVRRRVDEFPARHVPESLEASPALAALAALVGRGRRPAVRERPVPAAALAGEAPVPGPGHLSRSRLPVVAAAHPGTGDLRARPRLAVAHRRRRSRRPPGPARRRHQAGTTPGAAVERARRPRAHRRHHPERQDAAARSHPLRGHPGAGHGHRHRPQGRCRVADAGRFAGAGCGARLRLLQPGLSGTVGDLQPLRHLREHHRAGGAGAGPHARRRGDGEGPLLHGIPARHHRAPGGGATRGGRAMDHRGPERRRHLCCRRSRT